MTNRRPHGNMRRIGSTFQFRPSTDERKLLFFINEPDRITIMSKFQVGDEVIYTKPTQSTEPEFFSANTPVFVQKIVTGVYGYKDRYMVSAHLNDSKNWWCTVPENALSRLTPNSNDGANLKKLLLIACHELQNEFNVIPNDELRKWFEANNEV